MSSCYLTVGSHASSQFAIGSLFLSPFAAIMGIGMFALTCYYAYVVWGRIPFAACNLETATTAVKSNLGLAFYAYGSLFLAAGWAAWWMVAFVSTLYVAGGCDGQGNCAKDPSGMLVFVLLLSCYWTFQVIQNVVHVTVAGTVGTWWFVPTEGSSFCSRAVRDSFVRSVTTSFGESVRGHPLCHLLLLLPWRMMRNARSDSICILYLLLWTPGSICMGSLLVAIIEASKQMVKSLRESGELFSHGSVCCVMAPPQSCPNRIVALQRMAAASCCASLSASWRACRISWR